MQKFFIFDWISKETNTIVASEFVLFLSILELLVLSKKYTNILGEKKLDEFMF